MLIVKVFSAIAAAAFGAALVVALPGFSPEVEARTPAPVIKGDRLDIRPPVDNPCAEQAWPYYDANCLRSPARPNADPRQVRMVVVDRISR